MESPIEASQSPTMTDDPIISQPSTVMDPVPSISPPETPPGLAYLLGVNSIVIRRQREPGIIVFAGLYANKRWDIFDSWGQRIYFATGSMSWGAWTITIFDGFGQPVMLGHRDSGFWGNPGNALYVTTPQGEMLGGVLRSSECQCGYYTTWDVTDGKGVGILRLDAASYHRREFPLRTSTGEQVGVIFKEFGGLLREMFTRADTFRVNFPPDLNVAVKATLIFAAFMIDFMYEEHAHSA